MLLAICPDGDAQRIGRLLRGARGVVQHHRRVPMAAATSAATRYGIRQILEVRHPWMWMVSPPPP